MYIGETGKAADAVGGCRNRFHICSAAHGEPPEKKPCLSPHHIKRTAAKRFAAVLCAEGRNPPVTAARISPRRQGDSFGVFFNKLYQEGYNFVTIAKIDKKLNKYACEKSQDRV